MILIDARVFNTMVRIVFNMTPPCWIKNFFFLGVFVLLFDNFLSFHCKSFFLLSCNMDFLVNNIDDTITNSMNKAGFADFNKTFLCEAEHLCSSLKLLDCFSIGFVMLTLSFLSHNWVVIFGIAGIYKTSNSFYALVMPDLRNQTQIMQKRNKEIDKTTVITSQKQKINNSTKTEQKIEKNRPTPCPPAQILR